MFLPLVFCLHCFRILFISRENSNALFPVAEVKWVCEGSREEYPGCQRLFIRGFRFRSAAAIGCLSAAEDRRCRETNLWYRGYGKKAAVQKLVTREGG